MHRLVRQIRASALRGHEARLALVTLERVLVQRVGALREPFCPRGFVAELRCSRDPCAMTGDARLVVDLFAAEVGRGRRCRGRLRLERRVVLPRDGDLCHGFDSCEELALIDGIDLLVGLERPAGNHARKSEQHQRHGKQDAEHQHESVEEGAVVLCAHWGSPRQDSEIIQAGPVDSAGSGRAMDGLRSRG